MRVLDLPVLVLHEVGAIAVEDPGLARAQRRRVLARLETQASRLHADELHVGVRNVRVENAHRVRSAAHARDDRMRLAAAAHRRHLREAFLADDGIEVAHHHRIRVRSRDGADDVERVLDVGHPVAHRLVERVLQRARAALDRHHLRAEELHAIDVLHLARDVLHAHVDDALHAVARGDGRRGHTVHSRAGLGDDARLAHALGEQRLADGVVHLVRAGVIQVFALDVDLRAADRFGEALRVVDRARAAHVVLELPRELLLELGILAVFRVRSRELVERLAQRLRDEDAAVRAEMPGGIRRRIALPIRMRNIHLHVARSG